MLKLLAGTELDLAHAEPHTFPTDGGTSALSAAVVVSVVAPVAAIVVESGMQSEVEPEVVDLSLVAKAETGLEAGIEEKAQVHEAGIAAWGETGMGTMHTPYSDSDLGSVDTAFRILL